MATVEVTKENLQQLIDESDTLILDFWASWCGPCMQFAPTFEAASNEHDKIVFGKVDTEAQPELAQAFQIRSIPTLMVFREQVMLLNQAGALPPPVFEKLIAQVKEIDMADVHAEIEKAKDAEDGAAGNEDAGGEG